MLGWEGSRGGKLILTWGMEAPTLLCQDQPHIDEFCRYLGSTSSDFTDRIAPLTETSLTTPLCSIPYFPGNRTEAQWHYLMGHGDSTSEHLGPRSADLHSARDCLTMWGDPWRQGHPCLLDCDSWFLALTRIVSKAGHQSPP